MLVSAREPNLAVFGDKSLVKLQEERLIRKGGARAFGNHGVHLTPAVTGAQGDEKQRFNC